MTVKNVKKLSKSAPFFLLWSMGTIKSTLRTTGGIPRTNQQGLTAVYVLYTHKGKNLYLNTGIRIPPESWRGEKDQFNPIGGELKGRTTKNQLLGQLRRKVETIVAELIGEGKDPTTKLVKERFEAVPEGQTDNSLPALWDQYIADSEVTKTAGTMRQIRHSRKVFDEYNRYKRINPSLEEINLSWYNGLVKYLLNVQKINNNSVGKEVKNIKSFLNYVGSQGLPISSDVANFKVFKEKTLIIYLTQDELTRLYEYDFSTSPRLDRCRDLFVLQSSVGMRYSDLTRLSSEHIQGNVIHMVAYKNKKETFVPLGTRAKAILEKYDGELPTISEQRQNDYIKEACKLAGIDQPIELVSYYGGRKEFSRVPKYTQISTHTAVKTFITHCGEKGISAKIVSEITGKSVKVILDHYYGISKAIIISEMTKAFG